MGEPAESIFVPETGKVAIRDTDGTVSLVAQADLPAARNEGAVPATEAEYFGAKAGVPGQIGSGVLGLTRGVTFGLSDPLFVEGSRLIGGDAEAEDTRRALNLAKAANPGTTQAAEIAGAIVPAFFGGGAASAAELGTGALARFGARAAAAAPRAIGEGVGIGLGSQLSEDTLENRKFSTEAYLNSGLKGGALGLFLGAGGAGVLGAAGDKLGTLFGRGERGALAAEERGGLRLAEDAQPYRTPGAVEDAATSAAGAERKGIMGSIEDLRDQLTYKSTGANRTDIKHLGVGREAQQEEMATANRTMREHDLTGPLVSENETNLRVNAKLKQVGSEIAPLYKQLDASAQKPSMGALDEAMQGIRAKFGGGLYGPEEMAGAESGYARLQKQLGDKPSLPSLWTARRELDGELARAYARDPATQIIPRGEKAFRELADSVRHELAAAADRAGADLGGTLGDQLRAKNQLYGDLWTVKKASDRAVGRGAGNNVFSLQTATLGAGAIASGHPLALAAVGADIVRKKFGNQLAAHVLDAAAHSEVVQRAATKLDNFINDGTKAFVSGSKSATRPFKSVTTEEVNALREATRTPEAVTARVAAQLGDMPKYAPKTAQDIATTASRMAAWAQHALPKEQPPMTPQFGKPKSVPLSDTDRLKAAAIMETMNDGSIVVDRIRDGSITADHVATLRFTQPETYFKIRTYLNQHATDLAKEMTQQQLVKLGILFGEPLTESQLPENVRAFQASFSQGNQAPGKGGAGGNMGASAPRAGGVPGGGPGATQTQKLEAGTS